MTEAHRWVDDRMEGLIDDAPPAPPPDPKQQAKARRQEVEKLVRDEIHQLEVSGQIYDFKPEPRCHVCMEEESRVLVDRLLAAGLTYRAIVEVCDKVVNTRRRANKQIKKDSVYRHAREHFDVDTPAKKVYRAILEKQASERGQNYVDGATHVINHMSYLETMVIKGYNKLTSDEDNVSVAEGMKASIAYHQFLQNEAGAAQIADLMAQLNKIITVVHEVVPPKYHQEIDARLAGYDTSQDSNIVDAEVEEDDEIEEFEGGFAMDEGDQM